MFDEPDLTSDLGPAQCTYYKKLKSHVTGWSPAPDIILIEANTSADLLPAAYERHSSSFVLKGFYVRVVVNSYYYVATAVASLSPPLSLDYMPALVIEDEFIEMYSGVSALDALEQLYEEIEKMIRGESAGKMN
jgi:hypothetical protein